MITKPLTLKYAKTTPTARIERTYDNAGYDVWSADGTLHLTPFKTYKVDTGLRFELQQDWCLFTKERSSIGSQGVAVRAGLIDWSYRGNLFVCLQNCTDNMITIPHSKAIAQVVLIYAPFAKLQEIENVTSDTKRGTKGFGSTDQ